MGYKMSETIDKKTVEITSNVKGKLQKMINGNVFGSPLTFITEFFQNSYRARAKNVNIDLTNPGVLIFSDDGVGCKNIKSILTLDYSEWESTTEGFGIGFWSILAIPGLTFCNVYSKDWVIEINVSKMLASDKPEAKVYKNDVFVDGFAVTIYSDFFNNIDVERLESAIVEVGQYQKYNVYINNSPIHQKSIYDDLCGDYMRQYNTRFFEGKLTIYSGWSGRGIDVYYENRKVLTLYDFSYIKGIIELKPNKLKLKEPDRTTIVEDDNWYRFRSVMLTCIRDLYKGMVSSCGKDMINQHEDGIISYLKPKDYAKYLMYAKPYMDINPEVVSVTIDDEKEDETADTVSETDYRQDTQICSSPVISQAECEIDNKSDDELSVVDLIRRYRKKMVYVYAHDINTLSDVIQKAKYYGLFVIISENRLYENVFEEYLIPHISEIENNIIKTNIIDDVALKTNKETIFMNKILIPICKKYKLPLNTFKIGILKLDVSIYLNEKCIMKEKHTVGGLCDYAARTIYLDRKHLGLKRFALNPTNDTVGQHELKALLCNLPVIAHELAHFLHMTEDNTVEHFTMERIIYDEIVEVFL